MLALVGSREQESEGGDTGMLGTKNGGSSGGGAYLAGFAMPHDSPEGLRQRGYHMVSGAVDVGLFRSAAVEEDVKKFVEDEFDASNRELEREREREVANMSNYTPLHTAQLINNSTPSLASLLISSKSWCS